MKGIENEKFTIMKCDNKLVDIEMNYAFGKLINYTVYKECPDFMWYINKCRYKWRVSNNEKSIPK